MRKRTINRIKETRRERIAHKLEMSMRTEYPPSCKTPNSHFAYKPEMSVRTRFVT
jgi:hypothetical protein